MVLSKFDSLSVRPPTPPKDLEDPLPDADETLQFLQDPFGDKPALPKIISSKALLNTPVQSPSSDISIPSSSASSRKRVNFELQACTIPSTKAIAQSWSPHCSSPLRPLPQTRVSMPLKSILKASDDASIPTPADNATTAHKFKTFAEMLDSIVKLLASSERSSRLDAYHSLQRTMQAYDKIPDHQALKHKLSLLTQFIRRDVQAPSLSGSGLDSQLTAQAMKLLMALFRIQDLIAAMDDDFCSFIVDRITHVASDSSMPKTVVNTHLAVLMQQNFRPKTTTTIRVERILDVLETIQDRISGFSVQAYRIRIYRKLIQQRPDVMTKHTERWFKHTVKALVSGQKDISQSALDTTLTAAKTIGHDRHVAKSVLSVLNRVRSDGETIAKVMAQELDKMLEGDYAATVPQIWSVVTALMRESLNVQAFPALKAWLEVFERCLRSDKDLVKVHASVAFCFLLYTVNLAPNTSESWTKMFLNIPLHQLQRRIPAKKAERDAITSGYITLLYYALRPTANFEQLDRYWTEFVAGFWGALVQSSSTQQSAAACRVVSALFNGSRKPWNDQRALDLRPQYMVQRGELPLLDPKWVRRSLPTVLQFVEILLDVTPWSENEQHEDEPIKLMWLSLVESLVEASSKEIMASSETRDAIAHIINLLRRLWDRHTAKLALPQEKEDLWANKFCFLIETIVQKLGAFQFADKCLTRNGDNDFEVASTPSHRSRNQAMRTSPLLYLIDLLVNQSEGRLADTVRLRALKLIIEPCFQAQNTRLNRLDLLRDCASTLDGSSRVPFTMSVWAYLADLLGSVFQEQSSPPNALISRTFGKEYEVVVDLMALGSAYMLTTSLGRDILMAFIGTVCREAGEGALVIAVIEKISECVLNVAMDEEKVSCLPYLSLLLQNLPQQMSRRILHEGRLMLWPSSSATSRNSEFDPYHHLYGTIVSVGCAAYRDLKHNNVESTKVFLAALGSSIHHCQTSNLAVYLRKTQEVIRIWVEDSERKLQSKEQSLKALHHEVVALWSEISNAIERLPKSDSQILVYLESLVSAGFLSRRRIIVNISIGFWNNTFGKEESLRYPSRIEQALRQLSNTVELSLPSWETRTDGIDNELSFYDSDTTDDDLKHALKTTRTRRSPFKVSKTTCRSTSRSPAIPSTASRRQSTRQPSKIRLRHDDSQIKFEPILSSPSNQFNQESQILTERQKEMVERQRLANGLFAKMGAASSEPEAAQSPIDIHSDILSADDLPNQPIGTTPLKTLAAVGPMDVFLGSSPTPHARRSARHINRESTGPTTPTTIRTLQLANDDDIGSSPPPFKKRAHSTVGAADKDGRVNSSLEHQVPEDRHLMSFDEGTTIDEAAMLEAERRGFEEDNIFMGTMPEQLSPNIDLQLTAQIDADIQAHMATNTQPSDEDALDSNLEFVDAVSHALPSSINQDHGDNDKEVEDSQIMSHSIAANSDEAEADTSSVSFIGDSFIKADADLETPKTQALRRSTRRSMTSSPALSAGGKERKQSSAKHFNKTKDNKKETVTTQADDEDILDNITVAFPKQAATGKKRKSTDRTQSSPDDRVQIPETNRKRETRRSQSLLNQVENCQDVLVEDTPAPKRARQSAGLDVSTAKKTSPSQAPQTNRLSHVQVTPKRSGVSGSARETLSAEEAENFASQRANEPALSTPAQTRMASTGTSTPARSFTERVILTPRSIITQLRNLKDYLFSAPQLVLRREEEREFDDVLFGIRMQVHAAGRRGEDINGGEE